jgi:hypothetical protein
MKGAEYEEYVAELVRQLKFCQNAVISRNRKFQGKRQPGEYEIDVAVEITFEEAAYFLMIIECKDWKRPIDRPVVQKLAQTRDAISAHKAVIVSPVGFSQEAIDVAKAHGIALWVICRGTWTSISAFIEPPSAAQRLYKRLRAQFLIAVNTLPSASPLDVRVREFERVNLNEEGDSPFDNFVQYYFGHPSASPGEPAPIFNPIIKEVYVQITNHPQWYQISELEKLSNWVHQSQEQLRNFGVSEQLMNDMLTAVASDDVLRFLRAIDER